MNWISSRLVIVISTRTRTGLIIIKEVVVVGNKDNKSSRNFINKSRQVNKSNDKITVTTLVVTKAMVITVERTPMVEIKIKGGKKEKYNRSTNLKYNNHINGRENGRARKTGGKMSTKKKIR